MVLRPEIDQPRTPAGSPTGGQFGPKPAGMEATTALEGPDRFDVAVAALRDAIGEHCSDILKQSLEGTEQDFLAGWHLELEGLVDTGEYTMPGLYTSSGDPVTVSIPPAPLVVEPVLRKHTQVVKCPSHTSFTRIRIATALVEGGFAGLAGKPCGCRVLPGTDTLNERFVARYPDWLDVITGQHFD